MIALLDTSEDLKTCELELGCPVEQLLTPLTRFKPQDPTAAFAIENGAFARFDPLAYRSLIQRELPRRHLCRFVSVPDVVASARRTLEVFEHWRTEGLLHRWPLALVAQDGQEDLTIPWDLIHAIFIGGSTQWKLGPHAAAIIKAALALGKWVHAGTRKHPGPLRLFRAPWRRLYRRDRSIAIFVDAGTDMEGGKQSDPPIGANTMKTNERARTTKHLSQLAVLAYRKRTVPSRTDASGSPSESINRALLSQVRQARSLLADWGSAPPYEIPAEERWAMRGTELKVRRALYGR